MVAKDDGSSHAERSLFWGHDSRWLGGYGNVVFVVSFGEIAQFATSYLIPGCDYAGYTHIYCHGFVLIERLTRRSRGTPQSY